MPLVKSGHSMKPDMMFGWRPDIEPISGAPIPLYYEYETFEAPTELPSGLMKTIFYGKRYSDTHKLHYAFSDKRPCEAIPSVGYNFTFPPVDIPYPNYYWREDPPPFEGMWPSMKHSLIFDSDFESGNLDMVVRRNELEYDLYMRVDTNTRGNHQWFFFSAESKTDKNIWINIVNFTKSTSLYTSLGLCMKVSVFINGKWTKGGTNIKYGPSRINN